MSSLQSEEERQIQEAIALSLASAGQPPPANAALSEESELRMALELSMQPVQGSAAPAPPPPLDDSSDGVGRLDAATIADAEAGGPALSRLVFGEHPAGEVTRQWRSQGLTLADVDLSEAPGVTPFGAGLAQEHGGPCAILAAAQAFMLRRLLFGGEGSEASQPAWVDDAPMGDGSLLPSEVEAREALVRGLADILCTCAATPAAGASPSAAHDVPPTVVIALPTSELLQSTALSGSSEALLSALVAGADRPTGWEATLDALRSRLAGLESPIGALALLVSALLT